jgi:hypothetical protein
MLDYVGASFRYRCLTMEPPILLNAYFAHSNLGNAMRVTGVGGLLFTPAASTLLEAELVKLYQEYGVPWYQPSRCAAGKEPFHKLNRKHRERLRETIGDLAIKYATAAVSATVSQAQYRKILGSAMPERSDYEFCLISCLGSIKDWAIKNEYQGRVQYFFKAGDEDEKATDSYLTGSMQNPSNREYSHYESHAFKPKTEPLLNAGELFAWEAAITFEGVLVGRDTRQGFLKFLNQKYCEAKSFFEEDLTTIVGTLKQGAQVTAFPPPPGYRRILPD